MVKLLLAKSASAFGKDSPPTILEHCCEVRDAAEAIWNSIKGALAVALNCDESTLDRQIRPLFIAAALLHDLGKANSAFQAILPHDSREKFKQPVRHEILCALLLADPDLLGGWFATLGADADLWPIIWAVAAHHLKMSDPKRSDPAHG
jgi:CRISPR-associated endonuclease Cas3-HD